MPLFHIHDHDSELLLEEKPTLCDIKQHHLQPV